MYGVKDLVSGKEFLEARKEILNSIEVFSNRRFRVYCGDTHTGTYTGYKEENCVGYLSTNPALENNLMIKKMSSSVGGYAVDYDSIIRIDDTATKMPILMHGRYNLWLGSTLDGDILNVEDMFNNKFAIDTSKQYDEALMVSGALLRIRREGNSMRLNGLCLVKETNSKKELDFVYDCSKSNRTKDRFPRLAEAEELIVRDQMFTGVLCCGAQTTEYFNSDADMIKFEDFIVSKKCYK